MSWAVCYSGSNNAYFNSPPIMADGRTYSTWQPEAVINRRIQAEENIHSNWHYRQFLQTNGMRIMNYNTAESCYMLGMPIPAPSQSRQISPALNNYNSQQSYRTPSDNVPHRFRNVFDSSRPGYGYCNSDLKNPYLSREQLNARMIAPTVTIPNL
jgi:hypothetical protein